MDDMFEGVPLTEAERTAYSCAFDAVCRLDEAKATAERLRVAAGRTTGQERDLNVRQAKEAEAEVSRLEAALRKEEMAASPERPVSEQGAEPKADVPRTTCDELWVQARTFADEFDAIDHKAGAHDSLKSIADRVAERMRECGIHGPRGPLSGGTILREALQGGRWKRKQMSR